MDTASLQVKCTAMAVLALSVGCTSQATRPPAVWDGLELRSDTATSAWYVQPGLEPRAWRTVMIDLPVVTIDENWDPTVGTIPVNQGIATRRLSAQEIDAIKDVVGTAVRRIFIEELESGGYRVVDQAQYDTVRLRSGIADIWMDTPERGLFPRSRDDQMTLVMELSDATTTRVVARYVAREIGALGMLQEPNTVVQDPDFRRAVRAWARDVRGSLDAAHEGSIT